MEVCALEDSVRFARSHDVRSRRSERGLPLMSFLYFRLNSCANRGAQGIRKRSPPTGQDPGLGPALCPRLYLGSAPCPRTLSAS